MPSNERGSCALTDDVLDAWLDGRTARHAAHVAACGDCTAALSGYERLSTLLRTVPVPQPPPDACTAILAALKPPLPAHAWVATRVLAPAMALCILAVAFGSWRIASQARGAVVGGVHRRPDRQPVRDAWVVLLRGDEVAGVASTAASRGGFRFDGLRPGAYDALLIGVGSPFAAPVPVSVQPDRTARLPLFLDPVPVASPAHLPVGGCVADRDGLPVAGALVVLVQAGRVAGVATTNSQGRYAIAAPAAGAVTVWSYAPGCERTHLDAAVSGSVAPVQLDFRPPRR
jgi:hypothetical protein